MALYRNADGVEIELREEFANLAERDGFVRVEEDDAVEAEGDGEADDTEATIDVVAEKPKRGKKAAE